MIHSDPLNQAPTSLECLFERQLILISGKGGTGKTTLSVFLALMAARQGKSVLLCHVNRLEDEAWEQDLLTPHPHLHQIRITPNESFKEYILLKLRSEALYHRFFEASTAVDVLRRAAPALNELLIIGKVYYECKQRTFWFGHKWDHVIVDLPSTGHALTILNIPKVVCEIFTRGIVANETGKIQQLISDPKRTCAVLVALPEHMVVRETLSFIETAQAQLQVALGPVFVNKMPEQPFSQEALRQYVELESGLSADLNWLVEYSQSSYEARKRHLEYLKSHCQQTVYTLPNVPGSTGNPEFNHQVEASLLHHWMNP